MPAAAPPAAAVVGAGIGGLTAALALAARGYSVTLFERRTGFAETGAGIQLSPNASRILIDLGFGPALRRTASEPERVVVRALRSGRVIGAVALGAFMRERFGAPYLVIRRADLHTLLLDALRSRPNLRLLVGRQFVAAEPTADGVAVTVEKPGGGSETHAAGLVVGADGLWSKVREAAFGGSSAPVHRGEAAWRASVARADVPEELAGNETGLWLGPGRHVVHYPIAGGQRLNLVVVRPGAAPDTGWSAPGDAAELGRDVEQAAEPLRRLLGAASDWQVWSLFDRPATAMAKGRVALIGDAAHPVMPFLAQGGALAIEDAAVLAARLAAEPADAERALAAFARERLERVRRVQAQARRNGRIYHAGLPLAAARDWVMGRTSPQRMAERYAWLYGWTP